MRNLLSANFMRLRKSVVFWLGMIFMFSMATVASTTMYREGQTIAGYQPHIDNILFSGAQFLPIVAAVFIGLFIGTEYSDGTIRNKIAAGQSRAAIYLANLITCSAALLLMHLAALLAIVVIGIPLVGNVEEEPQTLLLLTGLSLATVLAVSALFLLLAMLVNKKSVASVAALLLAFGLLMASMTINFRLQEPEYYPTYSSSLGENGTIQDEAQTPERNPHYLEETKREVYAFLDEFLPSSQFLHISQQEVAAPLRLVLYSLVILAGTTACGVVCFGRKDLK